MYQYIAAEKFLCLECLGKKLVFHVLLSQFSHFSIFGSLVFILFGQSLSLVFARSLLNSLLVFCLFKVFDVFLFSFLW